MGSGAPIGKLSLFQNAHLITKCTCSTQTLSVAVHKYFPSRPLPPETQTYNVAQKVLIVKSRTLQRCFFFETGPAQATFGLIITSASCSLLGFLAFFCGEMRKKMTMIGHLFVVLASMLRSNKRLLHILKCLSWAKTSCTVIKYISAQ